MVSTTGSTECLRDFPRASERVRGILQDPSRHPGLPAEVRQWLDIQRWRSALPNRHSLLVEGFPRGSKQFIVAYCFEGRNAHQTLGMLLPRRMERMGLKPLGFDDRFRRLWEYYLAYCEAGFLSGNIDVRQVVFAKTK